MKFNQMISTLLHSHFSKQLNSNCKTTTYHYSSINCSLFTHISQNSACSQFILIYSLLGQMMIIVLFWSPFLMVWTVNMTI